MSIMCVTSVLAESNQATGPTISAKEFESNF